MPGGLSPLSDRNIFEDGYKFLFEPLVEDDMLTVDNLRSVCQLEGMYIAPYAKAECSIKSLPRLLLDAIGKNPTNCELLEQSDIDYAIDILETCADHYYNGSLFRTQAQIRMGNGPITAPEKCIGKIKFIHEFLYYLVPIGYYKSGDNGFRKLRYILSFTYKELTVKPEEYYEKNLQGKTVEDENVRMIAVEVPNQMDLRYHFFNKFLVDDIKVFFVLAMILVMFLMGMYTRSGILMLATVANVFFSFNISAAVYFFVCRITYFPFMNLLASLVLIAVGADNVFIFYDTWRQIRAHDDSLPLEHVIARTFSHAALAIFVTSLTTAAALFTSVISSINCVRCYGIFAGLCIIVNFILMMTFTAPVIVCIERSDRWAEANCRGCLNRCKSFDHSSSKKGFFTRLWSKTFPKLIKKFWIGFLTVLSLIGLGSIFVTFISPRLQLPEGKDMRFFPDPHYLENWDMKYSDKFSFSMQYSDIKVPAYFVFGYEELSGKWHDLNHTDMVVKQNRDFDFYSKESQTWLLEFCHKLKNQSFVSKEFRDLPCAIDAYGQAFEKYCLIPDYQDVVKPCCKKFKPPYGPKDLEACLPVAETLNHVSGMYNASNLLGKPIYDLENQVTGFFIVVVTSYEFSMSYGTMDKYYKEIRAFFDQAMKSAPLGLDTAFFSANNTFQFYDLQSAVADGTFVSIGLSLAVAFIVMLVTSLNILITTYAFITISFSVLGTVACTVLMGWHLDIAESITISLAVGLSIDFTIHYGVAYRISPYHDNKSRVRDSFAAVGGAVAMAALTTFAAGLSIIPSHILCYRRLGIFLVLCMVLSWLYSTFLFQSLCYKLGPSGNLCQITTSCDQKRKEKHEVYMARAGTLPPNKPGPEP